MTAEVIGAAALEMAAGREADAVAADGAAAAREPTAWTAPLGVADAGAVAEAEADGAEAGRVTADAAEVATDPAAWSAPLGPEVAAAGATEVDGAEAGRADAGAGAEAGAAATLTGLGAGVVAPWVPVEPTAWTVELTAWVTLDGAAATDDSGEEPVAPEPDVAGATRVECPVDVELADGVAVDELAETEAAADVAALAGVELAGAFWDWLDEAGADCEAAVEAGGEAEPFADPEPFAEPECPAEAEAPVEDPPPLEPEPPAGAVDWAGAEGAEAAESPCESVVPTGLAWDDALWATAEATEPTVCRALPGPEEPAAEDGDDGVVSA